MALARNPMERQFLTRRMDACERLASVTGDAKGHPHFSDI
jgi:hypothetical protein